MFKPADLKKDFPILERTINGQPLVYLDNAATSQKPRQVIEAISNYYLQHNANVHRGVHTLGDESTALFHTARKTIADYLGAEPVELIIVRNTTEAVNQVALSWGAATITDGDTIVLTEMEHHSNLVPWQQLAKRQGAKLEFIRVTEDGRLDLEDAATKISQMGVKLLAFSHISNTLGTLNPLDKLRQLVTAAEQKNKSQIKIFVDGAQAAPHLSVNFKHLDVDFYAVSAHKMLGPMGIGGLLVKKSVLMLLEPLLLGGGMINTVSLDETTFADDLEERFTAGTPDVASLVGWAAACEYMSKIGMGNIAQHDQEMLLECLARLKQVAQVQLIGPTEFSGSIDRVGSVAFIYQGVHAHDVGQVLDSMGVAVRSGHHCTMPLHEKFGWQASTRVSWQLYNDFSDLDTLLVALQKVASTFGA
ncbi:MAG: SufS family cysteine desulfurase [bacterium]|nr:SufS family cysteine desulfurase [bacterium]